jgi:hypothetical protein
MRLLYGRARRLKTKNAGFRPGQCHGNCGGGILQAMMNVADATKHPEFKGTVGFVDSHPLMNTPSSNGRGRCRVIKAPLSILYEQPSM